MKRPSEENQIDHPKKDACYEKLFDYVQTTTQITKVFTGLDHKTFDFGATDYNWTNQ